MTVTPRVLFYVQHLLGIGHLKRAALIARALADEGLACDVVLGGPATPGVDWGNAALHQLPELRSSDSGFSSLETPAGVAPDEGYWGQRRARLLEIAAERSPAAVLIELYPFGRRAFRRELKPLLTAIEAPAHRPLVMCSVRDILVDKGRADRHRETADIVKAHFDAVLVHGDEAFVPLGETFPLADEIADKLIYTGYVAPPSPPPAAEGAGDVVVAAGGGAVGSDLLLTALAAKPLCALAGRRWRFLVGPNLDDDTVRALDARTADNDGIVVEPNRPDYPALLANAAMSISQGGYNTIMDLIRARCPAVVVPFADGGETEQTFRAKRLAKRGYVTLLPPDRMNAERLAEAIDSAANASPPPSPPFDLDGARASARYIRARIAESREARR